MHRPSSYRQTAESRRDRPHRERPIFRWIRIALVLYGFLGVTLLVLGPGAAPAFAAAPTLKDFLAAEKPQTFHPKADRIGAPSGTPPTAPLFRGDQQLGHVFLNSDFVNSTGYSGKPIYILIGLTSQGVISGAKMVKHSEPIVLVGIPEKKVVDFINGYLGKSVFALAKAASSNNRSIDIVSGATVTIMVIDDSIIRSSLKVARLKSGKGQARRRQRVRRRVIDMAQSERQHWEFLLGDGSVRRLLLSVSDVNRAFRKAGHAEAVIPTNEAKADDTFIDLYAALVSIPTVGRSLLGDAEYNNLRRRLKPGQHAVLLAGNGRYSFKGSGYVRGGIFDRIQLIQGDLSVRFRDKHHKRIGDVVAQGAPRFREIALFRLPQKSEFRPDRRWRIQLLALRAVGPIKKVFLTFDLGYNPPRKYFKDAPKPAGTAPATATPAPQTAQADSVAAPAPLWKRMWQRKTVDIVILLVALGALTVIFFFQNWIVQRRDLTEWLRLGFLIFTAGWLGFYAQAQLSVVNVLTFSNAALNGFKWEYFLTEPMIFILWCSVIGSLPFWGRGVFCGWLCPFGALQELLNKAAKVLRVPQIQVPWGLHERLWPIKYIIFLGIFGVSFYSLALAEKLSEVEPFKTAIVLHFVRDWWFVAFAAALLVAGLFIERFFCRYLCPLGAALALPGRMRMFEWLRRYKECGSPCHICANTCMVQAIHPNGQINPNECLYCLHCQQLYYDDHECPVMIKQRERRERRCALSSDFGRLDDAAAGPAAENQAHEHSPGR